MSRDLEKALREALRPVDPGEEFTARVLSRLAAQPQAESARRDGAPRRALAGRRVWIPLALAASLVAAVVLGIGWYERREVRGLEARRELLEALRVTNQKLELANRLVNGSHAAGSGQNPGA